jgi:hypothetical protein
VLDIPYVIFNPSKFAIEDISLVAKYPGRFGLSNHELENLSLGKRIQEETDEYLTDRAEFFSRRKCQVNNLGITGPRQLSNS